MEFPALSFDDPKTMGILALAANLLKSSGPSPFPVPLGAAVGNAGMGAWGAYASARDSQRKSQQTQALIDLEKAKAAMEQQKLAQAQAQFAMQQKILGGLPLGGQPVTAGATPPGLSPTSSSMAFGTPEYATKEIPQPRANFPLDLNQMMALRLAGGPDLMPFYNAARPETMTVDAGNEIHLIDKNNPGNILQKIPKGAAPGAVPYEAGGITPSAFRDFILSKATAGSPKVTVDNRQENEFGKAVGKAFGEQYTELMKADMNAPANIGKYQRLGTLLSQAGTGKFTGTTTELKAAVKALGIDLGALGVSDNVAPAQAARALANQLALELRNPAGGAGMPGAMSDKDREFLIQMIPSLESDPQAWPKMIEYRVKLAQREQQVARMAREYRKKNNKFDEGFFNELQEWSNKNPLFPESGGGLPQLSPKAQKYLKDAGAL